jgi:hypothetical protein
VAADAEASRKTWLKLSKCKAGAFAGFMTGLLAGLGVAIALSKELHFDGDWVACGVLALVAALGGMYTGAIAAGCYRD